MEKSNDSNEISAETLWDLQMELCPQLVFFLNPDHTIRKMSKRAMQYFGNSPAAEFAGRSIFSVLENPVLLLLVKKWFARLETGKSIDEYIPLDTFKTGRYEWYHVKAFPAMQGELCVGHVFFIDDATELYSQRRVVDTLMASSPGDVLVFDRSLKILLATDSMAVANGRQSWRDLVGMNIIDLKTIDVQNLEILIDRIILGEEVINEITQLTDENGVEQWFYVDLRTVNSSAGTFGYMLTYINMTGEIKAKAMLDSLMDASSDALAIINPEGALEYVSRSMATLLHFSDRRELSQKPWNQLFQNIAPEDLPYNDVDSFGTNFISTKNGTIRLRTADALRDINYKVDTLRYRGKHLGYMAVATDITELVAARDKAEEAVRAKAAFLANMSHELRTPMNAVLGMNELLSRTRLNAEQQNYISHIRSSAGMLLGIINDILDFSRMEAGSLVLSQNPWHFNSMLHDVLNLIHVRAHEKELAVTVDLDPGIPSQLIGDEIRVKQILVNLLNNAIKFTEEGSVSLSIQAVAESSGDWRLIMSVADTGIGIPTEKLAKIFSRFTRVEGVMQQGIEGSGLGLSICQSLALLMGGEISVQSTVGAGSVFSVQILQKRSEDSSPIADLASCTSARLLVYERDQAAGASIARMAERAKIEARFCSTMTEFTSALAKRGSYSHVVFEFKSGYEPVLKIIDSLGAVPLMALMTLSDFTGDSRDARVDCVFKPLLLPVLVRFLTGHKVDFSGSLGPSGSFTAGGPTFRAPEARVLVVDDSAVNRKVALGFLQTFEIRVDEAEDGYDALEKVAASSYDLIFMDHRMPGIDGIETTKRIRELGGRAGTIPIIALTANTAGNFSEQYVNAGMNDQLYKPVEYTAFMACLKRWLPPEKKISGPLPLPPVDPQHRESPPEILPPLSAFKTAWIPGLDRDQGIGYTGSERNLEMILGVFNRTGGKMLSQLEQGRSSGDRETFRIAVHSLVSSIANIGGVDIPRHARELEQAIMAENTAIIDRLYPLLREELAALITDVAEYLEKKKEQAVK